MTLRDIFGKVVSDRMDKTVVVAVKRSTAHPRYGKVVERTKRYKAHDEYNQCQVGDLVRIREVRPLSREKRWVISEIISKQAISQEIEISMYSWDSSASFPDRAIVGRPNLLVVDIKLSQDQDIKLSSIQKMSSLNDVIKIDICPIVSPINFDTDDQEFKAVKTLEVPLKEGSASIDFTLIPKREFSEDSVGVEFFQGTRYLGELELKTKAVLKSK